MARVSRKGKGTVGTVAAEPSIRMWNTAVYARLSVEDSGRKNSDTIETQIELVSSYISQQPHLSQFDIYADNGVSGKDFERPSWNRLMDDIRSGRVDCVVVKDLSRFSRNYIETIEYIEKIFPFMCVRFISVNDGYDSETSTGNNERLIIALKSLVNDRHIKDISRKMVCSHNIRREKGEFTGLYAPLGYAKSATEKGRLVIDEEIAPVIKKIYEWRAEGIGKTEICKRLDNAGIPTPLGWRQKKYGVYTTGNYKATIWQLKAISQIIRSKVYLGQLELGKRRAKLYDNIPKTFMPKTKWILAENTHEPIISLKLWEAANAVEQGVRKEYAERPRGETPNNIFRGFLKCGICDSGLGRSYKESVKKDGVKSDYSQYFCPLQRQHPKEHSFKSIHINTIYSSAFPLVDEKLRYAANLGDIIAKRMKRQSNPRAVLDAEISRVSRELETINSRIAGLYENYVDKLLTEQEYIGLKAEYSNRADMLKQRIGELSKRAAVMSNISESDNKWLKAAKDFQNPKELTREMLEAIVERIIVFDAERIEVVWKFKDEFELLESIAAQEFEEEVV
ncbi:MAG: recombinase family protein [Oscillospiraceae bacterium]|nr:recombinase family protein [Oscillospiraceae bacterium]